MPKVPKTTTLLYLWNISKVPKRASLQCLYNIYQEDRDEVGFLHADNYQSSLQVDYNTLGTKGGTRIIDKHDDTFSNYSK